MERILVVDDEQKIRRLYTDLLLNEGYDVFSVANAIDTNEVLKKNEIDLILLDIKMPDVAGDILYDVIKKFYKNCKVIVTSVYPVYEQRRIIKGADDYFDKSHGPEVLLTKIKSVFNDGVFKKEGQP